MGASVQHPQGKDSSSKSCSNNNRDSLWTSTGCAARRLCPKGLGRQAAAWLAAALLAVVGFLALTSPAQAVVVGTYPTTPKSWKVYGKAGLGEEEQETLDDILSEHLAPLMESASDAAMQFELREFNATLNALWSGSDVGKAKRLAKHKGNGEGVKPTGTGNAHQEATDITPTYDGKVRRRSSRRLPFNKWKLQAVGGDEEVIGRVDVANHIIYYHTNNKVVEKFQTDKNYDALLTACAGILVNTQMEDGLPFDGRWASTLSQVLVERLEA